MKSIFLTMIAFLFVHSLAAQPSPKELLAKKWKYLGTEEFSVITSPDSLQKGDMISFTAEGTYEWTQNGKKTSGTYKLNESGKIISFTDSKTKKTLTYNLKKITVTDLTIEYQTPDLIRTKFYYQAVQE